MDMDCVGSRGCPHRGSWVGVIAQPSTWGQCRPSIEIIPFLPAPSLVCRVTAFPWGRNHHRAVLVGVTLRTWPISLFLGWNWHWWGRSGWRCSCKGFLPFELRSGKPVPLEGKMHSIPGGSVLPRPLGSSSLYIIFHLFFSLRTLCLFSKSAGTDYKHALLLGPFASCSSKPVSILRSLVSVSCRALQHLPVFSPAGSKGEIPPLNMVLDLEVLRGEAEK